MAEASLSRAGALRARPAGGALARGVVMGYLSLVVLLPLAAVAWASAGAGLDGFRRAVLNPAALASLELTLGAAAVVALANAVMGTLLAWVLVRDPFPGSRLVDALVDLPFALPTIVAGLTLLALYGPQSPLGIDIAYTRAGVVAALLFVTLPFVVRTVQPVLLELDREPEEAAASLGASGLAVFRRVVLPGIAPAILAGAGLAFARAVGEFGAVVLISGNIPFETEVAAVHIFGEIESDAPERAAAMSVCLLVLSGAVLLAIEALRRRSAKHER